MSEAGPFVDAWFGGAPLALPDDPLACVLDGPVAHVVLNQPRRRNAMSARMWRALPPLVARLDADAAVRLVVLRGAGEAAFSGGADIAEFREVYADAARARAYNDEVRAAQLALERMAKPSIALIRGACVGGGCGLALACDLRFAAADARLGITPGRLGAAYSLPDTRRLVVLVGPSRAKDMLFSGRLLGAVEAAAIGLVDRVVAPVALDAAVADYARTLLANSSQSIRYAKRAINAVSGVHPVAEDALDAEFHASFTSADFREGFTAFCEKRPPRFG